MKKIILKFEADSRGILEELKTTVDLEYQAGSAYNSELLQVYNIQDSLSRSLFEFVEKIGIDVESFFLHMEKSYNEIIGKEQTLDFDQAEGQMSYDVFLTEFGKKEEFRQKVFQVFQMYMNQEDDEEDKEFPDID